MPSGIRSRVETVAGGSVAQMVARVVTLPIGLLSTAIISRYLGVSNYGNYTFVLAFWAILNLVSEMYVTPVVTSEMAKPDADPADVFRAGLLVQFLYTVVCLAIGFVVIRVAFWERGPAVIGGLLVGGLVLFASLPVTVAPFQLRSRMWVPAFGGILQSCVMLVLFGVAAWRGLSWQAFVLANALSGVVVLGVVAWIGLRSFGTVGRGWPGGETTKRIFVASVGLGLAGLFSAAYFKLDSVLVYSLAGSEQAGLYGAAYRLYELVLFVPTAVNLAALSAAARRIHTDAPDTREYGGAVAITLLAIALGVVAVLVLFGRWIVALVFGAQFAASTVLLLLLAPGIVSRYLHIWYGSLLISAERRKRFIGIVALCAIIAVGADLLAIPKFGAKGAAVVTSVVETGVMLGTLFALPRGVAPDHRAGLRYVRRRVAGMLSR